MRKVIVWFICISLITEIIGLYVGMQYISLIRTGAISPVVENPASPLNALKIFIYLIITTIIVLIVVRFLRIKNIILRGLELLAVFFSSWLVFDIIVPFGIVFAIGLTIWRALKPNYINKTLASIFAIAGAGALIGASIDVLPAMIFVVILSLYDFVSVFITKHMVYMAKAMVESDSAFTFSFPYKFKRPVKLEYERKKVKVHVFQLGGGDILVPLLFSVSVLRQFTIFNSVCSLLGSFVALGVLLYFATKKPGRALPALPAITAGMLISFLLSLA
jgi:presenilin-like A22 family membrane protease